MPKNKSFYKLGILKSQIKSNFSDLKDEFIKNDTTEDSKKQLVKIDQIENKFDQFSLVFEQLMDDVQKFPNANEENNQTNSSKSKDIASIDTKKDKVNDTQKDELKETTDVNTSQKPIDKKSNRRFDVKRIMSNEENITSESSFDDGLKKVMGDYGYVVNTFSSNDESPYGEIDRNENKKKEYDELDDDESKENKDLQEIVNQETKRNENDTNSTDDDDTATEEDSLGSDDYEADDIDSFIENEG